MRTSADAKQARDAAASSRCASRRRTQAQAAQEVARGPAARKMRCMISGGMLARLGGASSSPVDAMLSARARARSGPGGAHKRHTGCCASKAAGMGNCVLFPDASAAYFAPNPAALYGRSWKRRLQLSLAGNAAARRLPRQCTLAHVYLVGLRTQQKARSFWHRDPLLPADATHVVACCPLGNCTVPRESILQGHHAQARSNSCLNGSPATRRAAASGLRVTKLH